MAKWGEIKCPRCDDTFQMYVDAKEAEAYAEELEAKLAKAVEQLLRAAEQLDAYVGYGYGDEFREAVAELTSGEATTPVGREGGKDE